jgi:hypothetical protein
MTVSWSGEHLDRISQSGELQIASRRRDGTLRRGVPIWVPSGHQSMVTDDAAATPLRLDPQ